MRILVIGATGSIGSVAATTLAERGHEVIRASRSSPVSVDITDPASIAGLFTRVGEVDGVVVASGAVPFQPLTVLGGEEYRAAVTGKAGRRSGGVRQGSEQVRDGGSSTLTPGVRAREPIATGAAAAMANGDL